MNPLDMLTSEDYQIFRRLGTVAGKTMATELVHDGDYRVMYDRVAGSFSDAKNNLSRITPAELVHEAFFGGAS